MMARARMKLICVSISVTGGIPSARTRRSIGFSAATVSVIAANVTSHAINRMNGSIARDRRGVVRQAFLVEAGSVGAYRTRAVLSHGALVNILIAAGVTIFYWHKDSCAVSIVAAYSLQPYCSAHTASVAVYPIHSWRTEMAKETKREQHRRLTQRTEELKKEHAALDLDRKPFNQAEHDEHTAKLRQHRSDLIEHRKRRDDA
jgi:C4-dicarboxylate-specific signal transduction histidine kinase